MRFDTVSIRFCFAGSVLCFQSYSQWSKRLKAWSTSATTGHRFAKNRLQAFSIHHSNPDRAWTFTSEWGSAVTGTRLLPSFVICVLKGVALFQVITRIFGHIGKYRVFRLSHHLRLHVVFLKCC